MKKITFTPTDAQAKFINLYQKVQGSSDPQEIISLALDKLEEEQKSTLYDKLDDLLSRPGQSTSSPSGNTSAGSASVEGHD